jgi:hypothetical protein
MAQRPSIEEGEYDRWIQIAIRGTLRLRLTAWVLRRICRSGHFLSLAQEPTFEISGMSENYSCTMTESAECTQLAWHKVESFEQDLEHRLFTQVK